MTSVYDPLLLSARSPHHALIDRVRSAPAPRRMTAADVRAVVASAVRHALQRAIESGKETGRSGARSRP
jgi:hypothetical protein